MDISNLINKDRLVNSFIELININSPSFYEIKIGQHVRSKLEALGLSVYTDDYGESFNLICRKSGTIKQAPCLMLCSHLDTVASTRDIKVVQEKGIIKTDGKTILGADDKSGIAQILEAVSVLCENSIPHGDIEIVFTSVEEKFLYGSRKIALDKLKSKHAVIMDSNQNVGKIIIGAPTHDEYKITVTGRQAHAGIEPEKGISAISVISEIVTKIPCIKIDRYDDMMKRIGELEERNKLLLEYKATKEYDIRQRDHAIEKLKERIAEFEQDLEHARQSFLSRILSKFR
ncbi:peptidase T-like protein [Candidatus Magnetoovum chiemensis]|nr:peptidase T-like protein [Candidatus Magnetoovum chiemensis]